jgi:DNA-binding NtrC family response regulator
MILEASTVAEAVAILRRADVDVVVSKARFPDGRGIHDLLQAVRGVDSTIEVVALGEADDVHMIVRAIKDGAFDFLEEGAYADQLRPAIEEAGVKVVAARDERRRRLRADPKKARTWQDRLVGESRKMRQVKERITVVGATDATVLITGESGTGKELVARALHEASARSRRTFVAVNCGAIPENLQEAEFFGHVRGAFTGAVRDRKGLFEEANGGTLFLDEIGETTLQTQVKLLRFLQEGEIRKVGGDIPTFVDVRLIAATNQDLKQLIRERWFREDLYYRLNIINIDLPALRNRSDDIPALAWAFLERHRERANRPVEGFSVRAVEYLRNFDWPGNVRELENAVQHALAMGGGRLLELEDLPLETLSDSEASGAVNVPSPLDSGGFRDTSGRSGAGWDLIEAPSIAVPGEGSTDAAVAGEAGSPPDGRRSTLAEQRGQEERVRSLEELEAQEILKAYRLFRGHRTLMAEALGISKTTLWRKLKKLLAGSPR